MSAAVDRAVQALGERLQTYPPEARAAVFQGILDGIAAGILTLKPPVDPKTLPKFVNGNKPTLHDVVEALAKKKVGDDTSPRAITGDLDGNEFSPGDKRYVASLMGQIRELGFTKATRSTWKILALPKPEDYDDEE